MKIAARATAAQPFYAMSIGERAGILQAEGHSIAKLSLGEPDFGAPPAVREEMRRVMDGRPLPYSPALGLLALREAIAGFYRDRHGVEVDPGSSSPPVRPRRSCWWPLLPPSPVTTSSSPIRPTPATGSWWRPTAAGSFWHPPVLPAATRWTVPLPSRCGLRRRAR